METGGENEFEELVDNIIKESAVCAYRYCTAPFVTRRMLSLILFGNIEVISSLQLARGSLSKLRIFKVDSNSSDALRIVSMLARSTIGSLTCRCVQR
jgi:hypothetical protein